MLRPISIAAILAVLAAAGVAAAPAVPVGTMPAELEFRTTLHAPIMQGVITANVSVTIPSAGNFSGRAALQHRYVLIGPLAGCTHNLNRADDLLVRGVRTGDALALDVAVTPRSLRRPAITCPRGGYGYGPPLPAAGDGRYHLRYAHDAERTWTREYGDVRTGGRVRLKLACVGTPGATGTVKTILPQASGVWPLHVRNTVSKTRIGSLRTNPERDEIYGLTRPVEPMLPTHAVSGRHLPAALRGGVCYWVDEVKVEFPAIEIYIASEYRPDSCNYAAVFDHEYKHYQDLARTFREGQHKVRQDLQGMTLPGRARPAYFSSREAADRHFSERMDAALYPTIRYVLDTARTHGDAWHAEDISSTLARCGNW